jgi:hypothetical protein
MLDHAGLGSPRRAGPARPTLRADKKRGLLSGQAQPNNPPRHLGGFNFAAFHDCELREDILYSRR